MGRVWDDKYVRDEKQKWRYRVQMHLEIDDEVRPFLKLETKEPWLKRMRLALLFSVRKVAARAGLSPSAYFRYEKEEAAGSITLKALRRCADALDWVGQGTRRPNSR